MSIYNLLIRRSIWTPTVSPTLPKYMDRFRWGRTSSKNKAVPLAIKKIVKNCDCQWIKYERVSIFIIVLHRVWFRVKCLKQGIKNRNSVLNRVGKSAIFVLNRVRVWGAGPHLPTQGYIEYPPPIPRAFPLAITKSWKILSWTKIENHYFVQECSQH